MTERCEPDAIRGRTFPSLVSGRETKKILILCENCGFCASEMGEGAMGYEFAFRLKLCGLSAMKDVEDRGACACSNGDSQ